MDDEVDRPKPSSAKAVTALLREVRSLSRRADKLSGPAAAVDDPHDPALHQHEDVGAPPDGAGTSATARREVSMPTPVEGCT
ncbi:MAG: hypothetical protein H0V41_04620 [Pseudonocardiales bacterium]|nr:hypothetical protein [Pseudonocardiales bacterium]